MSEYGLVLCGGGGRGAYQVGVWKALVKSGLAQNITGFSGASVGALNAALFATVTAQGAEKVWESISQAVIADPIDAIEKVIGSAVKYIKSDDKSITKERISGAINSGLFSREGLIDLIESNGINLRLSEVRVPCFACCTSMETGEAEYFDMRAYSPETITKILIASSAIPAAFPPEKIGAVSYRDGGIKDNCPIKPLYNAGFRRFIISYLGEETADKSEFPDAEFIELVPSDDIYLGERNTSILNNGTMDFNAKNAAERIALGEHETAAALGKILLK
ncbi:MAG: patatin-like phospholipase family protein [Oscillospiraceae bacterium]|nr:patatin-like phospholipase family protein [Oscillospiraceae bacterium]